MFYPSLKLLVAVDEESTVSHRTIEKIATTCKFCRDVVYGSEIVIISLISAIMNTLLSWRAKLDFLGFCEVSDLKRMTFFPTRSNNKGYPFPTLLYPLPYPSS